MPLDAAQYLIEAGRQAPSAENSQPWRFTWREGVLALCMDEERIKNSVFDAENPATLLAMGAAMENMIQAGEALTPPVRWEMPPRDSTSSPCLRAHISPDTRLSSGDHRLPLYLRHTNRLAFKPTPLPATLLNSIKPLREGEARVDVFVERATIRKIGKLVRQASEARFQTPEIHDRFGKSLRFNPEAVERGDGLDVATFSLPPGGRLFLRVIKEWRRLSRLNRVHTYRLLALIEAAPVIRAPALLAITSPRGYAHTLDAGRVMARTWIELNTNGVAAHPFYVVSDQLNRKREHKVPQHLTDKVETLAKECGEIFNLKEDTQLQMLLRIGFPRCQPRLSRRLPLDEVCADC